MQRTNNLLTLLALALAPMLAACTGGTIHYSQAQLNAIESREVDAGMDETYAAASEALFDSGYTVRMSDREAGLITGTKTQENTGKQVGTTALVTARNAAWITLSLFAGGGTGYAERYPNMDSYLTICLQIEPTGPSRCTTRLRSFVNGEPKTDKAAIDQIWLLMQRQVLMKDSTPGGVGLAASPPATAATPATSPSVPPSTPAPPATAARADAPAGTAPVPPAPIQSQEAFDITAPAPKRRE